MKNFPAAARLAEDLGFPVLVRNSGGGAVAANRGSISFSLTFPVADLRHGLFERYADGVELIASAIRRVGVAAEGGAVEGEFCPGEYSVRSGGLGGVKHSGLAQRVMRGAARLEALILVEATTDLVPVLTSFYGALGLPFRPESVGDLPATVPQATQALVDEVTTRYGGELEPVDEGLLSRAGSMRDRWRYATPEAPA
jgi:octanoyl-[GcvH]:protein N-octanoyltransferase